ncbi:REP-associated tyrosine transposase [Nodosilinea sp. PGN35]|uniref:REP-associated tyrosine transposase n=1 Tax=Nodosilinea sp. PGN35 TaxID=3020489 RepID=UPI0023B2FAC9|nr:transposase [Nodosilinea sp. TSF1-S3]MDF0366391.1 transposase [Nodosilinea sp. TSF1-S3]
MPRRDLTFQPGHYYHLYNRGNDRQPIFFERENYLHFLRLIRRYLIEQPLDVVAYCLIPNHYHLLVRCKTNAVSGAMMRLSVAYTKAMNRRYNRVGVVFQGQFQAVAVDSDEYLYHLTRYIHLNPVKAGLVAHPRDWEFSSYLDYAGLRSGTLPRLDVLRQQLMSEAAYQTFLKPEDQPLPTMTSAFATNLKALMLDE